MSANIRKIKFVNLYKLYSPLTYNPAIDTELAMELLRLAFDRFFIFLWKRSPREENCDQYKMSIVNIIFHTN